MNLFCWFLVINLFCLFGRCAMHDYKIFCYWSTWAYYREGDGRFNAWNIEPKLCTHLAYAFFGIGQHGEMQILDKFLATKIDFLRLIIAQKRINPKLKVLASIGGWQMGSDSFSQMADNRNKREKFITSILEFLQQYSFDGVDLDWEYPAERNGKPEDRQNFADLLTELSLSLRKQNYLLTVAVGAKAELSHKSYDIPHIARSVDFINLMAYDYNKPWSIKLAHNAPLWLNQYETESVQSSVEKWLTKSGNATKILLGIPLFGRTYTLANVTRTDVGSEALGVGLPGKFTRNAGMLAYNEFCLQAGNWKKKFDDIAKVPYAHKDNQWISYEDPRSISEKVKFIQKHKLGGAMVWSIDMDDFRGTCGMRYPLMQAVNLHIGDSLALVEVKMTTEGAGICPRDGIFSNTMDCARFYECHNGKREDYECLNGLHYDPKLGHCNLAHLVQCDKNFTEWKPGTRYNFRNFPLNLRVPF